MACWPNSIDAEALLAAARQAYAAGYRKMNAYTPFPVEGLSAALGQKRHAAAPDRAARAGSWAGARRT